MAALAIPKSSDSLSAEWLTAALQGSGAGNARVASFEYEPIAAGVGFLGKLGRLRLRYADDGEGCRERSSVKQPTPDEKSRQLAMMFRFYEREVCFYRDIGSRRRHSCSDDAFRRRRPTKRRLRDADGGSGAGAARRPARRMQRRGRALGGRRPRQMSCACGGRTPGSSVACLAAGHQRSDQSFRPACLPRMLGAVRAVRRRQDDAGAEAHGRGAGDQRDPHARRLCSNGRTHSCMAITVRTICSSAVPDRQPRHWPRWTGR